MSIRRLISLHNKAEKKILVCMTLVIMLMMTAGFTGVSRVLCKSIQ